MNYRVVFILIFGISALTYGQSVPEGGKYIGFEIYFIEDFQTNKFSYMNMNKRELRRYRRKFKNKTEPDTSCEYYIDLKKNEIADEPFLGISDIQYYDEVNHTIALTDSGKEKIKSLVPTRITVFGKPFIIVANGKKLLGGWFWTSYSSSWCDRIKISIEEDTESLKLEFGGCGNDTRNDSRFIKELTKVDE